MASVIAGLPRARPRAALLAIRGATNAVSTGSRMQSRDDRCPFCRAAPDSLGHMAACASALRLFCAALRIPEAPHIVQTLASSPTESVSIWAAFVEFVTLACVTKQEVAAREATFLTGAAVALARAHLRPAGPPRARRPAAAG